MALIRERLVKEDFEIGYGTVTRTADNGGSLTGNKVGLHTFNDGVINVKHKGAIGNGTTDDTAAIQAALDSGEPVVVFPKPTTHYRITDSLIIPSNRLLVGNRSKIRQEAATAVGGPFFIGGVHDVQVDGFEVDCLSSILGENGIGIARDLANTVASSRIWITNNYVHGYKTSATPAGGCGIITEVGCSDIHILGNTVDDCSNGIWMGSSALWPTRDYELVGNHASNIVNNQADLRYCGNAFMIDDPGGAPAPSTNVHNGTITGNTVNGAPVAFHVLFAGRVNIVGNSARLITSYGYFNQESWYINFSNNTIQGAMVNYVKFLNYVNLYEAWHNIVSFNNFLGTASGDGVIGDTSASRCYFFLNKMQGVSGARYAISSGDEENVRVDAEDAALTSLIEITNGITVPNNVAYKTKTAAGAVANIVKADANNDLLIYRPGNVAAEVGRVDNGTAGGLIWGATAAGDDTTLGPSDIRVKGALWVKDGMAAPTATVGFVGIYADVADGDLKAVFGDGTVKTIVVDT